MQPALALTRFETPLPPAWEADRLAALSASEHARLARIQRELRRAQFIVGHYLLRRLLSNAECADAQIEVAPDGGVLLRAPVPLFASISHSARFVAALIAGAAVGVDIESGSRPRELRGAAEMLGFAAGAVDDTSSVLRAWVAAEARLKAGTGDSAQLWRSSWADCQIAVAGTANPPFAGVFDARTGIYNPCQLQWEAVPQAI